MTKQEITDTFALNIEIERTKLGYTQAEMAEALDMSLSSYKNMINGMSVNLSVYSVYLACQLTGKYVSEMCGFKTDISDTMIAIRDLPSHRIQALTTMVKIEHDLNDTIGDEYNENDYTTCYVALGNQEDGMILNSVNLEAINISAYRHKFPDRIDCAIRITTNHLHPAYHIGDILLVCQKAPRDGDIGIFINKETMQLFIRRFRQTEPTILEPITDFGEPIRVDSYNSAEMSKWLKFGYVITKMR